MVTDGTMLKVYAWYDNEVGYACRMVDLANIVIEEELMSAVRNYAVVTASYWSFTLTDGALRMLVLLHFYALATRRSCWRSCSCCMRRPASSPISAADGWRRASAFRAC